MLSFVNVAVVVKCKKKKRIIYHLGLISKAGSKYDLQLKKILHINMVSFFSKWKTIFLFNGIRQLKKCK